VFRLAAGFSGFGRQVRRVLGHHRLTSQCSRSRFAARLISGVRPLRAFVLLPRRGSRFCASPTIFCFGQHSSVRSRLCEAALKGSRGSVAAKSAGGIRGWRLRFVAAQQALVASAQASSLRAAHCYGHIGGLTSHSSRNRFVAPFKPAATVAVSAPYPSRCGSA
jgi:hypothetical protein